MAHLNYIRGIDYQNNISLPQFSPAIFTNNSFSAFCGTSWQRSQIGLFCREDAVPAVVLSCS